MDDEILQILTDDQDESIKSDDFSNSIYSPW